ncbi:zinc-binding dehydrogenase [Gottfriedia sp. NPDC056225]|uniref:zinc-binding dehydrogenase n=1 Tax=Gottfriedia sp. NPDC056225 TaxID=3345751 RepID=UPI0035DBBAA1
MKGKMAYQIKPLQVEVREYDLESDLQDGSILLKVLQTNVCGSELHIFKGDHPLKQTGKMGHEMVGQVVQIGANVKTDSAGNKLELGDRVVPVYFATCNKCRECLNGNHHHCEHNFKYDVGTFASHYEVHHDQYFFKVPDTVTNQEAASANCALSQVLFGLDKVDIKPGDSLVIQGAGGLGLNACAVAKEKGAYVIVIDTVPSRLAAAESFGADVTINITEYNTVEKRMYRVQELTGGIGADYVLEVSGVPEAFSEGIHLAKTNGIYVTMGNITVGKKVEIDPGLLVRKALQIIPVNRYNPEYLFKALQFLERNAKKYPFEQLLDASFTLEEVEVALQKSLQREVTRATIIMD